jgi:predicted regulator of Ras-like GTPase activity (Roadblock/LC7/MglB family)
LKNIDEKQKYIEDKPYNTKEDKMFENVFDEFETISGFAAAGIYDGTGKILTSTSNTNELDFNEVGEQAIKLYKAAKEVCSKMKIGTTNFIETHTDNFTFIHTCIVPSKGAIGVVLKKNGNIGMTRYHMNEVVNRLRPQFK